MRIRRLTLQHFRNVDFAALAFEGRQQFFVGANGQGKTNLLEAAGFITALRSFRTSDNKLLIAHGQSAAGIACEVEHERLKETKVTITLRPDAKELWCDQERVTKLADYLGRFPTVVFSSQDLQLVRGAPALRRRWLDLTLAAMDVAYLRALQTYTRALTERNALLKNARGNVAGFAAQFDAFERTLAPAAAELVARRRAGLDALSAGVAQAYAEVTAEAETASIAYQPDFGEATAERVREKLESGRARDAQFRTTIVGPHRDDLGFLVTGKAARDFASEGQQRSFVLALRLAQAAWFRERSGVEPVLLADDVLGELDPARRRRFWSAIGPSSQVIATGTQLPEADLGAWQVFEVLGGRFVEKSA
jgi:DNA replication and repair protein RecF